MKLAHKIEMDLLIHLMETSNEIVLPRHYLHGYECDVFAITGSGYSVEYEVKISYNDFKNDFNKHTKTYELGEDNKYHSVKKLKHDYIQSGNRTNKFYFVCPKGLIKRDEIPEKYGLIYITKSTKFTKEFTFDVIKHAKFLHKNKFDYTQDFAKQITKKLMGKYYSQLRNEYNKIDFEIIKKLHEEGLK